MQQFRDGMDGSVMAFSLVCLLFCEVEYAIPSLNES